jgi:hypothetical protein
VVLEEVVDACVVDVVRLDDVEDVDDDEPDDSTA